MKFFLTYVLFFLTALQIYAQPEKLIVERAIDASNFSVPSSAAFDLLGISPSTVHRPGTVRDFKLDWIFNEGGLNPNIAIELEPYWLFVNRYKSYTEFKNSNSVEKILSSLNVSVGTAEIGNAQSLAYALKVNIFNSKEAMFDEDLIKAIEPQFSAADSLLAMVLVELEFSDDETRKTELIAVKERLENQLRYEEKAYEEKVALAIQNWEIENWNATVIDAGFGQIFNYEIKNLDTLSLNQKGNALWFAAVTGIGKNTMINGMYRKSNFDDFSLTEIGGNIRYGSPRANFFIEYVNQKSDIQMHLFAAGLDYKMSNDLVIQASIKTRFDDALLLKRLIPTIDFNYSFN